MLRPASDNVLVRFVCITRTRHNITYNVPSCLVLKWPVVEPVTSVCCIYQQRHSHDWSVFLSPDRVTLKAMTHRRIYTIWFCSHYHRIDVSNFTKCFSETQIFVIVVPNDVHHRKLRIVTDCLQLYIGTECLQLYIVTDCLQLYIGTDFLQLYIGTDCLQLYIRG